MTLESLMAQYQSMVSRICMSYERDPDLARELAQEAWFAIWRALPAFRGEASPKTFVARIAQFRAISHVAKHARVPISEALSEHVVDLAAAPEHDAIAATERERILRAVQRLPLVYRQPVILTLEDFSPPEIAELLGVSTNVIGARLTRARAMLRALLNPGET